MSLRAIIKVPVNPPLINFSKLRLRFLFLALKDQSLDGSFVPDFSEHGRALGYGGDVLL